MKQNELDFFRPLWRRVVATGFIAAWFVWELFYTHDQLWMMITGAALAYAIWNFFITYTKQDKGPGGDAEPKG